MWVDPNLIRLNAGQVFLTLDRLDSYIMFVRLHGLNAGRFPVGSYFASLSKNGTEKFAKKIRYIKN